MTFLHLSLTKWCSFYQPQGWSTCAAGPGGAEGKTFSFFGNPSSCATWNPWASRFLKRLIKFLKTSSKKNQKKIRKKSKEFQRNFQKLLVSQVGLPGWSGWVGRSGWLGRSGLWGFQGSREEVWVRGGKDRQVIIEESGVLRESETPSGDLLGYRLRYGKIWLI